MIAHHSIQLALRTQLLTLSVCTTGSTTLAASATGYSRTAGSFLTDGFAVGMEVNASGFATAANNGLGVITSLSALVMGVTAYTVTQGSTGYTYAARTMATDVAAAGRTLSVGLPTLRAWENVTFAPTSGVPYVEEQYAPGAMTRISLGSTSQLEATPMYSPRIYVPNNTGIGADGGYADALLSLFAPNTSMTLSNGDVLRVRGDSAPYLTQRYRSDPVGFSVIPVNIPLRIRSANAV